MKSTKASRVPSHPAPSDNDAPYILEEQIGFQLRVAMQRHTTIFTAAIVEGVTQTQFATMVKLRDVGSCPQNQLAQLVALDAATMNGVVERLCARGLLESSSDPRDGRRRLTALTPRGRTLLDKCLSIAPQITEETLAPLSAAERQKLSRLLKKIA